MNFVSKRFTGQTLILVPKVSASQNSNLDPAQFVLNRVNFIVKRSTSQYVKFVFAYNRVEFVLKTSSVLNNLTFIPKLSTGKGVKFQGKSKLNSILKYFRYFFLIKFHN